jgi:hypothetical protein
MGVNNTMAFLSRRRQERVMAHSLSHHTQWFVRKLENVLVGSSPKKGIINSKWAAITCNHQISMAARAWNPSTTRVRAHTGAPAHMQRAETVAYILMPVHTLGPMVRISPNMHASRKPCKRTDARHPGMPASTSTKHTCAWRSLCLRRRPQSWCRGRR